MNVNRRDFVKSLAAGAGALGAGAALPSLAAAEAGGTSGASRTYDYLGRTPGVPDWAVVDRGRTVKAIETFVAGPLGLVRVTASDGTQGWGQMAPYDVSITAPVLHQKVAGQVLNRDIADIDAICDGVIDANMKYPWSFVCRALAGVDTAIWDLYGQIRQKPVCELLGGTFREVHAYGSSMRRDISPADEAARCARLRDAHGYRGFKIRLGTPTGHNGDAAPGRSEAIIPAVRHAVGDGIELMADANSCYTPDKAIEFGRRLEDQHYHFFEEPCPYWELEWTQEVAAALDIPVAGGEQDNDLAQFRRMLRMRAVDIVQPDLCYVGGVTRAVRVARLAAALGFKVEPHSANLSLVTHFCAHVLMGVPNAAEFVEFSIETDAAINRQSREMFAPALEVRDGKAVLPHGPGWGVRVNPDWLAKAERRVSGEA